MKTPHYMANHIRRVLRDGGSAPHTEEVQCFFKEEIQSRGWYTKELRKLAMRVRRAILRDRDFDFLLKLADDLFTGRVLEEKVFAVLLLEKSADEIGVREFRLFERWLKRVRTWADHDALVYYLISPLIVSNPKLITRVFTWARSRDRWHRRAAAVALIRGARQKLFEDEIKLVATLLMADQDDMVQKGLGWLLREWAKFDRPRAVVYLMTIRKAAPRLVLRTACETLPAAQREQILARPMARAARA